MKYIANNINLISSAIFFIIFLIISGFNPPATFGDENITMEKIQGIWWVRDSSFTPWAIQFNKDGTFRIAMTHLRLEKSPEDMGRFKIDRTSITFTSSRDCKGSCKGLTGRYQIEFTAYNELLLKMQEDQCAERTEMCNLPFTRLRR